jgi:cysteine desulfurase
VIYLDNAATTEPAPAVVEIVCRALETDWGNASSAHGFGRKARHLVEEARVRVAALINARPDEIVFTSGGTEANNLAIKGVAEGGGGQRSWPSDASGIAQGRGKGLVVSAIEHPCVLESVRYLARRGWSVAVVPVDQGARVSPGDVGKALARAEGTVLVSVMLGNNETGTIQPVAEIAGIARGKGVPVHTDAVQAIGRIPVDVNALGVDYLTLSAHKFNGPKGVGALYVRRGARLTPVQHGGSQEGGRRSGTLNVAGIAGMGVAAELAAAGLAERATRVGSLRDRLERGIVDRIPDCRVNGPRTEAAARLPGHLNVSFRGIEGEALLMALDLAGIAVSTGSACSSGSVEPSHVLVAMGLDPGLARGAIRFSFGPGNTADEVDVVLKVLSEAVERLRKSSPTA